MSRLRHDWNREASVARHPAPSLLATGPVVWGACVRVHVCVHVCVSSALTATPVPKYKVTIYREGKKKEATRQAAHPSARLTRDVRLRSCDCCPSSVMSLLPPDLLRCRRTGCCCYGTFTSVWAAEMCTQSFTVTLTSVVATWWHHGIKAACVQAVKSVLAHCRKPLSLSEWYRCELSLFLSCFLITHFFRTRVWSFVTCQRALPSRSFFPLLCFSQY